MFQQYTIEHLNSINASEGASEFVKRYHYLRSLSRGNKHVFILKVEGKTMGIAAFGSPVGTYVKKSYGNDVIELKRFVLHPSCPKNTGSWFMSRCMKELKKTQWGAVISYCDPAAGHDGALYKASNFEYIGEQRFGTMMVFDKDGNKIHSAARKAVQEARKKGVVRFKTMPKKNIFMYNLRS